MSSAAGFFAIDQRLWARVCELGMNPAVVYLVLARGSGPDNAATTWSVHAVEQYTGIGRSRVRLALEQVKAAGLIRETRVVPFPRYELLRAREVPGVIRPALTPTEAEVVKAITAGERIPRRPQWRYQAATAAVGKGWLQRQQTGVGLVVSPPADEKPDWIWLPNELVTGAADETPPVELVRRTQDAFTLRLFIDYYHVHLLRDDGGISRRCVWQKFDREQVGTYGEYDVWGFRQAGIWMRWHGPTLCHQYTPTPEERRAGVQESRDFFRRHEHLVGLGLIQWVPYLFESDAESGEPIHPYGLGTSDSHEDRLGQAALAAAEVMVPDFKIEEAAAQGFVWLAPVPRHLADVQLIGLARLRYRPHTKATSAWWADLCEKTDQFVRRYQDLAARATCNIKAGAR